MTNDVVLRDVAETDLPIFFEQQLDPDASRMATFPARGRDAFMAHSTKLLRDKTVILKTILFNETATLTRYSQAGGRDRSAAQASPPARQHREP